MPIVNVPGVGRVRFPDEMSQKDIIDAIENDILKRPKDQSRTFAEVGTDLAASLGKGIGQLAQVPGQIGMLSGLYKPEEEETGIQGLGKRLEQYSESQKSAGLKAREAARAENIQAQTGILDEARVALMSTVTDPALLTSFFAEQVPNLIGSFGIGAVAKGGTKLLMREATEQALQKAGVRSAIGGNAVMQGADIGADTYEETLARLKQSQPNLDPQKAQELALGAGRKAAIEAATISLGTSYLPGGSTIERALVGRGLPGVGVTKGILGETLSEGLEEAGGAFAKNLSMSDVVPGVDLGKGVGAAGAFGALGGAMFGAPAALMGGRQAPPVSPVAQPVPEQQLIPQQAPAEVATLPPTPGGFTAEQANQLRQEAAMQEQIRLQEQADRQQSELQAQQEADRAEQEQRQAEGARVAGLPGFTGMPDANQQIISQARADQAAQIKKDENARRAAINRVMKTTFSADPVMQTIAQQRALEELGVPRVKANEITKADPAKQAELIEAEAPEFIPIEKPQKKPRGEAFFEVTPEDKKEVADLRDNLASVNKDLKAAEAGKGNLFNYLKGKLVDRPGAFSLADIDKDNKRLRQLYNPKGQGALLEDLVADGALDEYLPFDNRSTIEGFDPQTAIEYIAEKLRNGENFNEESSVRLRDLQNQKEELKSRIENLTSIPAANYELGQMAEQPRGELTEAGMRDLEDDARSIGVDVDRLREELSDSMPSASVAEFYGAYQNALFAATSKSPSYSIDGNQYTEQEIEAAISERFTENEINELIAETEAQQTTAAETTEVTEPAAEAAAPVRRADEAEAEATTTLEKPVQGKRAVSQGLPPILPELDKTPEGRHPQVAAAAKLRHEGKISREEFDEYVKAYRGIVPVSAEVLAPPASDEQVYNALRGDKAKSRLNPKIKDGTRVGLRMDLPAREAGTNVVSIHEGKENDNPKTGKPYSSAGDVIGYSSAARITDVKFAPRDQVKGIKMAYLPEKNPLQTAEGLWVNESPQAIYDRVMQLMRSGDPAWTQVNFDPGRHGYFYNRKTAEPVIAADEVLQVGNFLLAKNVQYGQKEDFLYSQKGEEAPKVDPEQAKMERELTGKSMIQAAQWAVNNAPNPFAKLTASKTLATIKDLEARGVTFNFEVQGGNERSSLLSGAEGLTHFLWGKEGTKVTVFLNGTPVFANQRGYPSGMTYDTLLHELLHVATRTSTRFLPPDHPLIKDLNELFNTVVRKYNADRKTGKLPPVLERYNKSMNNVLFSADELISWGMNDKEFQKYLSEIKVGEKTAFNKLIELVRKLIGMAKPFETALDRLVRTTEGLLDIDTEYLQNEMVSQTYSLGKPVPVQKAKPMPMRQQALFSKQGISENLSKQAAPTPTAVGEQALEILSGMGREPKAPDPGYLQRVRQSWDNAVDNPKATAEAARSGFRKFADMIETYALSSDAALNNEIQRKIMESTLGQEEKIGALMNVSLSQTVHSDAVSNLFLMKGDVRFNKELSKWEGVDSKYNIVNLSKKLDEIAAKYGLTKEQIQLISHTAFEAKRTKSLIRFNDQIAAEVAQLRTMAAEERQKGNAVKASTLSEKASNVQMKEKYIHMTDADIRAGMTQFELMPELSGAVDIWNGIRSNAVKVLVDSGLWTEEEADFLLSNADYVPFYREDQLEEGKGPKEFMRSLQVQAKERRLKGTDRPVNDIFDNMVRWTQYSINRAVRNRSAVALAKTAEAVGLGGEVKSKKDGKNVINVWIDGKETFFSMEDPMFMQAFQGLESVSIPTIRWAAKVADTLRQSVVLYPLFAVSQIPQDSFAAMFSSGLKPQHALTIPLRAMKEFLLTLANRSKTHNELKNFAVVGVRDFTSAMVRNDAEVYAGLKAPPGLKGRIKNALSHIAMASDNAVRQATYLAAQAQGLSQREALEKSFEIFNVRRKGSSRMLAMAGQLIPFFNAYLAAQTVAYKTITGVGTSPTQRAEAYKVLFSTTASVMTLSVLYAMMNGDDDDYLNKPTPTRDRLLMIPGSGGLSIPLRSDLFTLPKVIAEHTYLMLTDNGYEDGRKFRDSMTAVLANAFLSPTAVPQALKPLIEVGINYDFFQGKPLIGVYQKKLETERQFTDSTSEIGKVLGSTGIMSPIAIDHIARGMLGSFGGLVMYATNPFLWAARGDQSVPRPELSFQDALATIPNASGFISKEYESALRKDFYQLREATEKASSTLTDLKQRSPEKIEDYITNEAVRNQLGLAPAVESIARNLTKIRQAITQITNSQMPADEKAREIRNLREAEREMLKGINLKEMREFAKI